MTAVAACKQQDQCSHVQFIFYKLRIQKCSASVFFFLESISHVLLCVCELRPLMNHRGGVLNKLPIISFHISEDQPPNVLFIPLCWNICLGFQSRGDFICGRSWTALIERLDKTTYHLKKAKRKKNALHNLPKPKATSSNCLFCLRSTVQNLKIFNLRWGKILLFLKFNKSEASVAMPPRAARCWLQKKKK